MKPVHWEETQTIGHIWTNLSLLSTEEVVQMKSRSCNIFVDSMVELIVKLPSEQIVCMNVCLISLDYYGKVRLLLQKKIIHEISDIRLQRCTFVWSLFLNLPQGLGGIVRQLAESWDLPRLQTEPEFV